MIFSYLLKFGLRLTTFLGNYTEHNTLCTVDESIAPEKLTKFVVHYKENSFTKQSCC